MIYILGIGVFLLVSSLNAATITLAWNPNPESDIAGYRIHYGTQHGIYSRELNAGTATTRVVPDLTDGMTYFFSVTAYKTAGFESKFSDEVVAIAGGSTPTPTPSATPIKTPAPSPSPVKGTVTTIPNSMSFTATAGGPFPGPRNILVTTSSGMPWSSLDNSPWFNVHPTSGASGESISVEPHTENMSAGNYSQTIMFSAPGCPEKRIAVKLKLNPAPTPTKTPTPPPPTPTCTPCNCGK